MPVWWEHVHTEAALFMACCMTAGCIGGLLVTGIRIGMEVWRG